MHPHQHESAARKLVKRSAGRSGSAVLLPVLSLFLPALALHSAPVSTVLARFAIRAESSNFPRQQAATLGAARHVGRRRAATTARAADAGASSPGAGCYKALTRIRVRVSPQVQSATLADAQSARLDRGEWVGALEEGDVFDVSEVVESDGQRFLKLANQDGWVFSQGVAGKWLGKAIVEPVADAEILSEKVRSFAQTTWRTQVRDDGDLFGVGVVVAIVLFAIIVSFGKE